jgi:hypothetical protein
LLNSPAYRVLGFAAKALFYDLREKMNGSNNGNIEATLTTLKHKGWVSSGTLATALYELRALGFLVQTRGGGVEFGSKVCALYRFTDLATFDIPKLGLTKTPATHDYLRFASVGEAEAARKAGVQELRAQAIERKQRASAAKSTLQKMDRAGAKTAAMDGIYRFENRSSTSATAPKIAADNKSSQHLNSVADQGVACQFNGGRA